MLLPGLIWRSLRDGGRLRLGKVLYGMALEFWVLTHLHWGFGIASDEMKMIMLHRCHKW